MFSTCTFETPLPEVARWLREPQAPKAAQVGCARRDCVGIPRVLAPLLYICIQRRDNKEYLAFS